MAWIPPCGRNDAWVAGRGTKGTGFAVGDRAFLGTRDWIPPCGRNDAWVAGRGTKGQGWGEVMGFVWHKGLDSSLRSE